ncbi:phosphoribosyl-AMP cyclohydrolase [Shigella flexneri]
MTPDCDNDTLLLLANSIGPTCHKGTSSRFGDTATSGCSCINWEQTARRT